MSPLFKRKPPTPPDAGDAAAQTVPCDWCGQPANPLNDGFHLLQIAFGRQQQRFHFCSDNCYEAFRSLYPSRIHRNCYERSCDECDDCEKLLPGETAAVRDLVPEGTPIRHSHGGPRRGGPGPHGPHPH